MAPSFKMGQAINRSRETFLATDLAVANTHWTRLRGLLGLGINDFSNGAGLWILPCKGVHTLGMRFAIDVIYLNADLRVVDLRSAVEPWRFTPILPKATSVLELPCHTAVETKTQIGDTIEITLSKDCTQHPR